MTRLPIRSLALSAALLLLMAATACATSGSRDPSGSAAPPSGPTGTLAGSVTDSDGSAVGGTRVTVHSAGGQRWSATADMDGNFLLLDIPVGSNYKVTLSTPPFWTTTLRQISVQVGQTTRVDVVRRLGHRGGPMSPPGTGT